MSKKLLTLALSGMLLCSMGAPVRAAEHTPTPGTGNPEASNIQSLPSHQFYCGEVKAVLAGEDRAVTGLHMTSEELGEYVMKISDKTFWIDCGKRTPALPSDVTVGERLYVFHSPVSTRSMPPQSAAYAVVRSLPQTSGGAMYQIVEAVEEQEGRLRLTTDNGGLFLYAGPETTLSTYTGGPADGLDGIKAGTCIVAWYDAVALSYPGQAYAQHIMVLDRSAEGEALTRSALAVLLHTAQGSPVVNYLISYRDVDQSAPYAEAIRWAASEGIISGYDDGRVGPDDAVSREQLAVMLWRWSGSPMLMDYPGLTNYSDAGDIALFAQPALAWAHQKGLLPVGDHLGPKDAVSPAEAEAMLAALRGEKKPLER